MTWSETPKTGFLTTRLNYFLQKVELLIGENCYCRPLKRVWKKVVSQGKVSEKSGNFDMDIEWQPWSCVQRFGGGGVFMGCCSIKVYLFIGVECSYGVMFSEG